MKATQTKLQRAGFFLEKKEQKQVKERRHPNSRLQG
jgi:hypothetical protein